MRMSVCDLKKRNQEAVNRIKISRSPGGSKSNNLFFESLIRGRD